jgi:hypothetical protein
MNRNFYRCPKCGYVAREPVSATSECPACGAGFSLLQPLEKINAVSFYGRSAGLVLMAVWSWHLIGYDYRIAEINLSFMHDILLPIHEAGHVLFRPLGEFMTILGGSLFQLLVPLGIGFAFIRKNRDNFGGAMGFWLCGVSLVDLSPYIYDALHPYMTLLGGHTGADGPHDWIYLLSALGQLHRAQGWGTFVHACGGFLMIVSLVWGAAVLWRQKYTLTT